METMKDFVYLDTDSVSSISAQLFEGNIKELIDDKVIQTGNNVTDSHGTHESKTSSAKLGYNGTGIEGESENQTFENKSIEFLNNETFKIGVKKAYDDFLYNKIFELLNSNRQIHPIQESNQFDFVHIQGIYKVLDIYTSARIFDTELLRQMPHMEDDYTLPNIQTLQAKFNASEKYLKNPGSASFPKQFNNLEELKDFNETFKGTSMVKTFNEMTKHLASILGDKIIFYKRNIILIGDRKNLRIPGETVSLADEMNLKGFGRKITKTKRLSSVTNFKNFEFNKEDFLSKGTQGMLMIFLSSILNLKEKDTFEIIQPIGLEFSKVSR